MRKYFILLTFFLVACSGRRVLLTSGRDIVVQKGIVVSAHPEASGIGAAILKKGGNAIDAAVATEFALAVCYPEAGNIGGGGFMVVRMSDGTTDVIDYREEAPGLSSRDMFLNETGIASDSLSTVTHLSSGVPGTVDGMINVHSKYGQIPFRDVIQPSIDLARNGFHVSAIQAAGLNAMRFDFIRRNAGKIAFVKDSLWKEGEILVQPDLARTLERIRDSGREGFYSGEIAEMIIREMKRGNGIITLNDLSDYRSVHRQALRADYRGYGIITVPPPSGGGITLIQLLKMTESYPVSKWGFNSVKTIHLIVEAERRAFADRAEHTGDPAFMKINAGLLLDSMYLKTRFNDFDETRATPSSDIFAGSFNEASSEETTHYSVVDPYGNAVSATTTLNGSYGSGIVVEGAGFLMNNQMDDFSIKPGFPNMYGLIGGEINSIAPGKKMLSSMTPVIVEKEGKLFMVAGSPGGSTIPTTVFQVLTNVIDHEMNIREAVDTGRFHHQWFPNRIFYEKQRFDTLTVSCLSKMGHELAERKAIGQVNAVMILGDGGRAGGADRRGDNTSCGY